MIKNKRYLFLPFIFIICAIYIKEFFIINVTPSMPRGLYLKWRSAIHRDDIALFCLDEQQTRLGLARYYLESGRLCHGAHPLIKSVIAVPGDEVELTNRGLSVNKIFYPYPTLTHDRNHRALVSYPRGHYPATAGYWMIGTSDQQSWDSRYYGTVTREQLIAKLIPLIT